MQSTEYSYKNTECVVVDEDVMLRVHRAYINRDPKIVTNDRGRMSIGASLGKLQSSNPIMLILLIYLQVLGSHIYWQLT